MTPSKLNTLLLVSFVSITGCKSTGGDTTGFLHKGHRERYSIQDSELAGLPFYSSREVLARGPRPEDGLGEEVLVVPRGTRGKLVRAGPDWLEVRFRREGPGVRFTVTGELGPAGDKYWLATEVEGQSGYHQLRSIPVKKLVRDGRTYEIIDGAFAHLVVKEGELNKIINTGRRHFQGVDE